MIGTLAGSATRPGPVRVALLVTAAAWLAMIAAHTAGGHGHGHASAGGGPLALGTWILMCVAMMVPVALPAVHHVAVNSLRRRRYPAVAEFLSAYLAVWVTFGGLALVALGLVSVIAAARPLLLPVALLLAAAWQVQPWLRWFLWACHRTVPLPPRRWPATAGCLRFGLRHGLACVGVCWPFMLVMAVLAATAASGLAQVVWMAVLTPLTAAARLLPRSRGWGPPMAVGLASFALVLAIT